MGCCCSVEWMDDGTACWTELETDKVQTTAIEHGLGELHISKLKAICTKCKHSEMVAKGNYCKLLNCGLHFSLGMGFNNRRMWVTLINVHR